MMDWSALCIIWTCLGGTVYCQCKEVSRVQETVPRHKQYKREHAANQASARSQNYAPYFGALWVIMDAIMSIILIEHLDNEFISYQNGMLNYKTEMQNYQIKAGVHEWWIWSHV